MGTAGRIWEGDSVQLAANEVRLRHSAWEVLTRKLKRCWCRRGGATIGETKNTGPDHEFERDMILPEWHGWHAARRGLGTNLYRLGVPEKTIQAILRHANVSTTNTYYIKSAADDTRAAMAKLERLVIGSEAPTETEQHDIFASGNEVATEAADANPAAIQ